MKDEDNEFWFINFILPLIYSSYSCYMGDTMSTYCCHGWIWKCYDMPGNDKVRERGALLPANDKKTWGDYDTSVNGIWREFFAYKFAS